VKHLHDKNIVHRDIKPENILFETSEHSSTVKLIDFGLSRHHDPLVDGPYMTNRVGTPYYMSPDVLRGKYDRSCDLWSVGVVAYILLTGYPPFNGCNDLEVHVSIRSGYDYVAFDDSVWGKEWRIKRFHSHVTMSKEGCYWLFSRGGIDTSLDELK
jgi:serine/threonine protein kinase